MALQVIVPKRPVGACPVCRAKLGVDSAHCPSVDGFFCGSDDCHERLHQMKSDGLIARDGGVQPSPIEVPDLPYQGPWQCSCGAIIYKEDIGPITKMPCCWRGCGPVLDKRRVV